MKPIAIIFGTLLLALLWATASFADTGPSDGALDHFAQRSVHAPATATPAKPTHLGTCDGVPECADHVEHSCQNCLYIQASVFTNGRGGLQYFDTGHGVLAAPGYAQDILDPPRI